MNSPVILSEAKDLTVGMPVYCISPTLFQHTRVIPNEVRDHT